MVNLSPTLQQRVDAYKARKQHLQDKENTITEQNETISALKQIAQHSMKHNYGKNGLNLCTIHTDNNTEILLVNPTTYHEQNIQDLGLSFLDVHTICVLEMHNAQDTNTPLTSIYNSQTPPIEYCTMLGQQPECKLDTIYENSIAQT